MSNLSAEHRVRNGVLLILSPFIVLFVPMIIQFFARATDAGATLIIIVNTFSIITGIAGALLIVAGPILGILVLLKKL